MKEPMMADSHEITVRNYKQPMRNRLIMMLICIGIALISFFVVSKWATSVESYRWVIKTLNGLQKKALGLSGTATALATGAAAIPGEAATPIANKLADVAGYMVIVYAVIIVEKYLLTITGYIAFKILFRASGSRQLFEKRMERIYLQNRNQEYHSGCSFVGTGSYQCMGDEYGK